ncbi:hypothetical protein BHE74_00051563 [Ensete ventricosum]|nr:hypothetical protein BHE74_00051563 [Ensete ventricosum]
MVLAVSASVRRLSSSSMEATNSSISSKGWYSGFEFLLSESAFSSAERTLDFVLARRMAHVGDRNGEGSRPFARAKSIVVNISLFFCLRVGLRQRISATIWERMAELRLDFGLVSAGGYPQQVGIGGWTLRAESRSPNGSVRRSPELKRK